MKKEHMGRTSKRMLSGDPGIFFPRPRNPKRSDWGSRNKQPRRGIGPSKPPPKKNCPLELVLLPIRIIQVVATRLRG